MDSAVGINTGPGTFLLGVQKHFNVMTNLCIGDFGIESCRDQGISTTLVSPDYSTWPNLNASAVFGNAEKWETVQSAVKYVLANKIPIGMVDLRASFYLRYESYLHALAELCFENGYRVCYIYYSRLSFDTGSGEQRFTFVLYDKFKNFNITLPVLPEILKTLFDSIGKSVIAKTSARPEGEEYYERNDYYEVNYDEGLCIPKLRQGYGLRKMVELHRKELPGTCRNFLDAIKDDPSFRDFHKTVWGLKILTSDFQRYRFVHPQFHRQFTIGEIMSVYDWNRQPIGKHPIEQIMYGTPAAAGQWLSLQAVHYLNEKWGEQDYQIEYKSKKKTFDGGTANPLRCKKYINIAEYYNSVYRRDDPVIFPKKYRFKDDDDLVLY